MFFVGIDNFLLNVIPFDCFVALCHPLNYTVIMNPHFCDFLILMSWLMVVWVSLLHLLLIKELNFTVGTEIPHFSVNYLRS
jgi:olfactory receptor